jgi:peptidoglycan/LPS O-acetylase OafA/YrhL
MTQDAKPGPTISFVHLLRGIAPLLVVWAHLGGWWLSAAQRSSPLQDFWIRMVVRPLHLYQDGGHLGVLLFFLVSGFIITHVSLRETYTEFFVRRAFRLLPMLWLALAILPLLNYLTAALGLPLVLGNGPGHFLSGFFLLNYFSGKPQVLTVLWTLFIEFLFYALTLAAMGTSRRRPLLATWLMILVPLLLSTVATVVPSLFPVMWQVMYIPFLLIGRIIYLGWSKRVSTAEAIVAGVASYGAFLLVYTNTAPGLLLKPGSEAIVSHAIAILLFLALCFSAPARAPKPLAIVADISYSFYLLHAPLGGFMLFLLTRHGWAYETALPVTIAVVLSVSYLAFRLVELPAQRLGRAVAERCQPAVLRSPD